MKKLIILLSVLLLTSVNLMAKPVLSGYDYDKKSVYFEDSSIISFGKIVTVKVKYNSKNEIHQYSHEDNLIYFCPFDSLEKSSSKTNYYELNGTYKSTLESNLSEETHPISMESNASMDGLTGWSGVRKKLKSKCSKTYKKYPRFEVPLTRTNGDKTIRHITLDTIKSQGGIKSAWVKNRNLDVDIMKNEDGTPLLVGGQEWKTYSFTKDGNYGMTEYQVDCQNNKLGVTSFADYDSTGKVTKNESVPLDIKNMESILPNSIGEVIHNFICSF